MAIQEKIWGVVDAEGQFLEALNTRKEARQVKKWYNTVEPWVLDGKVSLPVIMVQYKRWKKAS